MAERIVRLPGFKKVVQREEWQERGLCHGNFEFLGWAYAEGQTVEANRARERAKALCALCPVRVECDAFAVANDEREGIWGGRGPAGRRGRRKPAGSSQRAQSA